MTPRPVVMQPLPGAGLAGAAKVGGVRNLGGAKRSSESRRSLALAPELKFDGLGFWGQHPKRDGPTWDRRKRETHLRV
jgi:hypothetical protein